MTEPTLAALPPTRRTIVEMLKRRGEASAVALADELGLTVAAVRQQLRELEHAGFVAHRRQVDGRGRPTHCYSLTPGSGVLFPQRYGDLANELLGYVGDDDGAAVAALFERRRRRRTEGARARLAGRSFNGRVRELARILEEDGYVATAEQVGRDRWRITEAHCAILEVAMRYGNACSSELAFLRDVLPEADIERVTHIVAGSQACGYDIRRRPGRLPKGA